MCGIAGIVALNGAGAPHGAVERMTAVLEHRGPDDFGHWLDGACALGHRRLKIIDLSANARQPLSNEDETVWLTYNGEVYNFVELRRDLEKRGHRFRSRTDSEVIVHLWEDLGPGLLERLDGMFAFGIWDQHQRKLLLARDRLGIKPLYYARAGDVLLFASEVKGILASGLVETRPDMDALVSYLGYRHPVGGRTMFQGIHALPAGHFLVAQEGDVRVERYWDLEMPAERRDLGEAHYIEGVRELLGQAVRKRLVSDVPLGAYLSGGLDSSVVVALMAQELGGRLKTYSVGFQDEASNEFDYARLVAQRYGTDHTEVVLDRSRYLNLLPELIHKRDTPLAVPNEVPLYEMSRVLKQDITVVLSGEGSDEIFGGYGDYVRIPFDLAKARALSRLPGPLARALSGGMERKYGGRLDFRSEVDHFLAGYKWFDDDERVGLLTPDARSQVTDGGRAGFDATFQRTAGLPYYDRVLYALEKVHLQNLLARVDSMTMATAVEGRVPFVDHTLVEFATASPLHYQLRWRSPAHRFRALFSYSDVFPERDDTTKYILRRAYRDLLPREIVERRKIGFKVPLERWFRGDLMGRA
ncbi:MAG: asparagine synthase (glutamine-hydrolyzing), partial [Dehalococcoidia bacterium]